MSPEEPIAVQKDELRRRMLRRRRALGAPALAATGEAVAARVLALPEIAAARCVAGYASFGTEPGTRTLLEGLLARGVQVLLPVLAPGGVLGWAAYEGWDALIGEAPGSVLRRPAGAVLPADALGAADVVLVPALAVDRAGRRLGRGRGSYDRALRHVPTGVPVVALLHEGELLDAVPVDPHDMTVTIVVTPAATVRTSQP